MALVTPLLAVDGSRPPSIQAAHASLARPAPPRHDGCQVGPLYVPPCGAWWGAAVGDGRTLEQHEALIRRRVDVYHEFKHFQSYDQPQDAFPGTLASQAIAGGRMYLVNMKPRNSAGTVIYLWADIAAGQHDAAFLEPLADNVREWGEAAGGRKAFLVFHHEPETDDEFGTPADYAAAYRQFWDVMAARGARAYLISVWVMSGYKNNADRWNTLYPGDAYVDWLGYDPYQAVDCSDPSRLPAGFESTFGLETGPDASAHSRFYAWATGTGAVDPQDGQTYIKPGAHDLPIMLAEWGGKYVDSDPASITTFFRDVRREVAVEKRYAQIKALVYYESGGGCHRVDSTAASHAAYRRLSLHPHFNQRRPY